MGDLDDQDGGGSPSGLPRGRPWWLHWYDGYAPQWRQPTSPPSRLVALRLGAGDTLQPIDSSFPLTHPFGGGRLLRRFVEFPTFKSAPS